MKASVMFLSAVVLVLVAMTVGATPVAADAPRAAAPAGALVISVEVDEAGGWVAYIGDDESGLSAADLSGLMALMGFNMPVPVLDASMVQAVQNAGVQSIALMKSGPETTILMNGAPLSAVRVTDAAVKRLTDEFLPGLAGLTGWLNTTELALVAYFPAAEGGEVAAVSLDSRVAVSEKEAANVVDVGATISSAGELLSVGGVNAAELGIPATQLPLYMLGPLEFDSIALDLGGSGVSLSADGEEWLSVSWDTDALLEAAPDITAAVGFPLTDAYQETLALAADWLGDTRVTVGAYVSDEAQQESAPTVAVGRPVQIAVKGSDLLIEGIDTGFRLDSSSLYYAQAIGSASMVWDGGDRQLRTVIGGEAMPALQLDDDFIAAAGGATMGSQFLPWDLFDEVISHTALAVAFTVDDAEPASADQLDYVVAYREPSMPFTLDLTVSRQDGRVAAWGEALPLNMLGMGISDTVAYFAKDAAPALKALSLDLGPTGISVGVNGSHASLVWDAASRDAVVGMALDIGGKQLNLPAAATSGLVETGIKFLLGAVNQLEVGVRVQLTDETIPQGSIESLVSQLALN